MPNDDHPEGKWTGWWEGVVDLMPPGAGVKNVKRETGLEKLFKKRLPPSCPETESSVIRLILPENVKVNVEPQGRVVGEWRDGKWRQVMEWNAKDREMVGKDLKVWWDEERFEYRKFILFANFCCPRAKRSLNSSYDRSARDFRYEDGYRLSSIRRDFSNQDIES